MRKFISEPVIALEDNTRGAVLSLEEEQMLEAEAADDAASVETDLSEAERVEEVSDALEDLAVIADGIDEATPAEINLIENSAAMAVAGTDIAPEEVLGTGTPIEATAPAEGETPVEPPTPVEGEEPAPSVVPAMESFKGKKIAIESIEAIKKKAGEIWEAIQKFLKEIWAKIEGFFYKMFALIPRLRQQIKDIEERVSETKGEASEKEVTIATGVSSLCVNYVPVKNESDLKKHFGEFSSTAKLVLGTLVDENCRFGELVASSISKFDPATAQADLEALNKKLEGPMGSNKHVKGGSGNANRYHGYKAHYSAPLLGNVSLIQKSPEVKAGENALQEAEYYRYSGIELDATSDTTKEGPKEAKIDTLSLAAMKTLLKEANDVLDTLEEFKRGSRSKKISQVRKDLESASDKASKAMGSGDDTSNPAIPYYRAMLNFNTAYTRWSQQPAIPFVRHSLATIRAVLNVVSKSLAAYK